MLGEWYLPSDFWDSHHDDEDGRARPASNKTRQHNDGGCKLTKNLNLYSNLMQSIFKLDFEEYKQFMIWILRILLDVPDYKDMTIEEILSRLDICEQRDDNIAQSADCGEIPNEDDTITRKTKSNIPNFSPACLEHVKSSTCKKVSILLIFIVIACNFMLELLIYSNGL